MTKLLNLGRSRHRVDGPEKLRGRADFVADLRRAGALSARLVLSPHAHARVLKVDSSEAVGMAGVVGVFTSAELGRLPALARDRVYYAGQPVALVVAESEAVAEDAADRVRVEYEPLEAVIDPLAAMDPGAPLTRPDRAEPAGEDAGAHGADAGGGASGEAKPRNVNQFRHLKRGDLERGWAEADLIIADTYRIAGVHQGYMETHGLLAEPHRDGSLTVYVSTQGTFTLQRHIAKALDLPEQQVRVVPMAIGGGFGGKIILHEALVAGVARRLGRPVRLIYDRLQDFLSSKPAPAAVIDLKMGARRDGSLTAMQARLVFDSGAAPGAPIPVASLVLASTYRVPNLDVRAYEVLTHKAPVVLAARREHPEIFFALESHMDRLARDLGLDPLEFRLRNAAREGDEMADGNPWPRIGLVECLERVRQHPFWKDRQPGDDEGFGLAAGGWLGGMEPAAAACRLNTDGTFSVQVGAVDLTGTNTTLAMIAGEVLGTSADRVQVRTDDTEHAPFAGLSAGSKVTYTVGKAVEAAAADARRQILEIAAAHLEVSQDDLEIREDQVVVRGAPSRSLSLVEVGQLTSRYGSPYPPVHGHGRSALHKRSPGFGVHVVRVRVDRETGIIEPLEYLAVQDVGKALNPAEVEGQIHGGVAQGLGRALWERMAYDDTGQLVSASLMDYLMPVATGVPPVLVEMVEVPSPHGPFGAKGVGEPPVVPCAAAVANAVADAAGVRLTEAPMTPELLVRAALSGDD